MPQGKVVLVLRQGYLRCHLLDPGVRFRRPAQEVEPGCAHHSLLNIRKRVHTWVKAH